MTLEWAVSHIVEFLLTAFCGGLVVYARGLHKHYCAMENGVQSLLRESIVESYRYYKARGYCEPEERITLSKTYSSYHELGGNDVATDLYNRVLALPAEDTKEPGYVEEEAKNDKLARPY